MMNLAATMTVSQYAAAVCDSIEDIWEEGDPTMTGERAREIAIERLGPCGEEIERLASVAE